MFKKLIIHLSNYSATNILVTIASIVSFPVLTRVFSVADYGILNLVSITLLLLVSISKLGVQHSALRFYSEVKSGKHSIGIDAFTSTVVFGMTGVGLAITLFWSAISQVIPASLWNDNRVPGLLLLTAWFIVIRALDSALFNQLRAEERSGIYAIYSTIKRYSELGFVLFVLFFISKDLWGYYSAVLITEVMSVVMLLFWMGRQMRLDPRLFSLPLYRSMLAFGIPMTTTEMSNIILSLGDRYVIQGFIGNEALGIYAATYNMCDYAQGCLIASVAQAAMPMYTRLWDEKGEAETRGFVNRLTHYYVMIGLPIIAGFTAIGPELLTLLASDKYQEGAQIIPWVISGMVVQGGMVITGAGLYLTKRAKIIALLVFLSAFINMALNFALVPQMGIMGAAIATLISYLFLATSAFMTGRRWLALSFPWWALGKFSLISLIMYIFLMYISVTGSAIQLLVKIAVGALSYTAMVIVIDSDARQTLRTSWSKLRNNAS